MTGRIVRTVRYTVSCPECGFHVSDSAKTVIDVAWQAHTDATGHHYPTTTTMTTEHR